MAATSGPKVTLGLLQLSDAFGTLWREVAGAAGAELCPWPEAVAAAPGHGVCGVVVAAGGEECAAVAAVRELVPAGVAVVVAGAETDYRVVMDLLRAGASEYVALPADVGRLRSWVLERVEAWQAATGAARLTEGHRAEYDFSQIIGRSAGLLAALDRASKVIPRASTTVLLMGETGTGKELFAQAIHYNSPRAAEPFVEINCTALPATLLEAELFGYERGAFTDARHAKPGLFEVANRGTLFLDEVGDLSPDLQAKLLKVLEERRVRRLGSVREQELDVRVISATNMDLQAAVRAGRFRRDLFYRLGVVPIQLPPLRERGEDVLLLAEHFLERFSREFAMARPVLSTAVRAELLAYAWTGNVRELRNAIERAVVLGGGAVRPEDLFFAENDGAAGSELPFPASLETIQRAAARAMVAAQRGNKSAAAEALGISRKYLYALLGGADES